ncbi:uncharacterized protein BYT42DRAFT_609913 [Radiomyces spectabilis]|uniref:uncharacterized protein n=1 Tax=Radiomyces spectabilis TaxID=64574 RepID=UPI00221FE9F4|nr:uncharacterized protein BYT42DRAFT_609913 [Radiomyces spectabilis]KAI8394178.1 hypothetical protein BYT42DRAFT_609913 [Radiomyces spectabilis]
MANIRYPSLAELNIALYATDAHKYQQPKSIQLCENAFDISRNDLYEEWSKLRRVFWTDPSPATEQIPHVASPERPAEHYSPIQPLSPEPLGQPMLVDNENKLTDVSTPLTPETATTSMKTKKTLSTMWPLKLQLIRLLTAANTQYDDAKILAILAECDRRRTKVQKRHLALYLLPIARAMQCGPVVDVLNRWCT